MRTSIWFHTLFTRGESSDPWPVAIAITHECMSALRVSGLLDACTELNVGINGIEAEVKDYADLSLPHKAKRIWHGRCFNENLTICALHEWSRTHPGWAVLYFHCKGGASHEPDSPYLNNVSKPWRETMLKYLVGGWRESVQQLQQGAESVGCHLMRGMADGTQNLWPGNFWWATSNFLATVPDMRLRDRIKMSGIAAPESRYEAEVWLLNGRVPACYDWLPTGGFGIP